MMIWTLIVGFVVGLLARAIKPGADSMGWILTIVLGIAGAYVGSFIAGLFGMSANQGFGYLMAFQEVDCKRVTLRVHRH